MASSTFQELLRCAREVGIEVRSVCLGGNGGGLANVKGRRQLFIDTEADPEVQVERTVSALRRVPEMAQVAMREDVARLLRS